MPHESDIEREQPETFTDPDIRPHAHAGFFKSLPEWRQDKLRADRDANWDEAGW